MQYHLTYYASTRTLSLGSIIKDDEEKHRIVIDYEDPDELLVGYTPYCIFEKGGCVEVVNGVANIPLPTHSLEIVQLKFESDKTRFYSLNAIRIRIEGI